MTVNERAAWLLPKNIMKLCDSYKCTGALKRLFVIGIGEDGTEILSECKKIAEDFFADDKSRLRFLAVGTAEYTGKTVDGIPVFEESERLTVDPEESIYPYMNDRGRLTEQEAEWFDEGLTNYTENKPVYGLKKRQGARIALFHYLDKLTEQFQSAFDMFAKSLVPVEIVITGNLGDAFFGGMFIDMAYILRHIFALAKYPVNVSAYMTAADVALLKGLEGRNLAIVYANTVVSKHELDLFQLKRSAFMQKYSEELVVSSDKPPFTVCCINAAEESARLTAASAANKIMSGYIAVYEHFDDAERLCSYNMLSPGHDHKFRFIASGFAANIIPFSKILSYLSLKMLTEFNKYLNRNSIGEMELGRLAGKATPDAKLVASKVGDIPQFVYDENLNPIFSVRSLKRGTAASKNYVIERAEQINRLCADNADSFSKQLFGEIKDECEKLRNNPKKGPCCAAEAVRRCLKTLDKTIEKHKKIVEEVETDIPIEEKILEDNYSKLCFSPFSAGVRKAADAYIENIKKYADHKITSLSFKSMDKIYNKLYVLFNDYLVEDLGKDLGIFDAAEKILDSPEEYYAPESGSNMREVFSVTDPEIREKLDEMSEGLSESAKSAAFRKVNMKNFFGGDPRESAAEIVKMTKKAFGGFFDKSFNEYCKFFGLDTTIEDALRECVERVDVHTPTDDETPVTRIICPDNISRECMESLGLPDNELITIKNGSTMRTAVVVTQIKGGVRLEKFKDYEQWENMCYAYVNDSLKKHGIHIFRQSN